MSFIYETEDGKKYTDEEIEGKYKCDFCGKLGEKSEGSNLPSIHSEGINPNYADICRECLTEGVNEDKLNEVIGKKEELQEKTVELE